MGFFIVVLLNPESGLTNLPWAYGRRALSWRWVVFPSPGHNMKAYESYWCVSIGSGPATVVKVGLGSEPVLLFRSVLSFKALMCSDKGPSEGDCVVRLHWLALRSWVLVRGRWLGIIFEGQSSQHSTACLSVLPHYHDASFFSGTDCSLCQYCLETGHNILETWAKINPSLNWQVSVFLFQWWG